MPAFSAPLPPGTILQNMYFKERVALLKPGKFVEIGCGEGRISKILLDAGWSGIGYDLNEDSLKSAALLNQKKIEEGFYSLRQANWLYDQDNSKVDLVISSLVFEHLSDEEELAYIQKCKNILNEQGTVILFVPNSPDHWGIEDEIAGHYRRYTADSLKRRFAPKQWTCRHTAGLTYPVSNLLLPISNRLVERAEKRKLSLNMHERTVLSSSRAVTFKTSFPQILSLVLNQFVMLPFHYLQRWNANNSRALILYAEFQLSPLPQKLITTSFVSTKDFLG